MLFHVSPNVRFSFLGFFLIFSVMAPSLASAQDSSRFSPNPGPPGRIDEINQLRLKSPRSGFSPLNSSTISVRELKIPDKAVTEFNRGLERLRKRDPAGSLPYLHRAVAIFPDYYEAFYHLGVAEARLHHDDEALEALQKAVDLSGGRYAAAQFAFGLILCGQGKPDEAERLIRAGLETDSDLPDGHFFLGIALFKLNRLEEAEKSLREAFLRKPDLLDAYLVLSNVHAMQRNFRAQLQDLDMFLKLAPAARQTEQIRKVREAVQRLVAAAGSEVPATSASNVSQ